MEQWVENKIIESDKRREEINRKRDRAIIGKIDKVEKKKDKIDNRVEGM